MLKWDLCLWGPRLKQNSQIFLYAYIIVYMNVNTNTDIVFLGLITNMDISTFSRTISFYLTYENTHKMFIMSCHIYIQTDVNNLKIK
jgi:hypothetical protein